MKRHAYRNIPYYWYWDGKPVHKGRFRGERIRPVHLKDCDEGACLPGPCPSRESLLPERASHSRCGRNSEEVRPSTPSSSDYSDYETPRQCRAGSHSVPEFPQVAMQCPCGVVWGPWTAGSSCPVCGLVGQPGRTVNPPTQPSQGGRAPSPPRKPVCCEGHAEMCCPPSCPPSSFAAMPCSYHATESSRTRASHPKGTSKCPCARHQPPPETEVRHPCCRHAPNRRSGESSQYASYDDDSASEASVAASSGSDYSQRGFLYPRRPRRYRCRHGVY